MKVYKITTLALIVSAMPLLAGKSSGRTQEFAQQKMMPFSVGEKIKYRIHYGLMDAGSAEIEVQRKFEANGKSIYHMVGTGKSEGMVDWFFPTKDRYETLMDSASLLPVRFVRDVNENGFIIKRNIVFNQSEQKAKDFDHPEKKEFDLPSQVQDIFSAFYFARTRNVDNIKSGDIIDIPVFLDHEMFPFKIKFIKRESIKTKFGKIRCLKFVPVVQEGRVFKDEDDMHLWITDDANHVPIRIQSELLVGSIKVDLENYSGLNSPLKFE